MAEETHRCYDELADRYHLMFDDWNASIARQAGIIGPLIEREAGGGSKLRILDCACGIGTQALGLAGRGHRLTGCDVSAAAIDRARREASSRGFDARFEVADMRDLGSLREREFDAAVCLDNALPHLDTGDQVIAAVAGIHAKLRPGGVFAVSVRDYDRLIEERPTVQGPSFYGNGEGRRIVHQVWDWIDELRYRFHLYITWQAADGWESRHYSAVYRAILREELMNVVDAAGFVDGRWTMPEDSGYYQPILVASA